MEDAPALFDLHQASIRAFCADAYSPAHLAAWFDDRAPDIYHPWIRKGRIWLAADQRRIVGFAGSVPGEITLLFIHPDAAGQGLGRRLFEHASLHAAAGFERPLTVVALLNSVSFYRRFGFVATGEEYFARGTPELRYPVVRMRRSTPPARE